MLETSPVWLEAMRQLSGVSWAPGDGPNSHIQQWLQFISSNYPNTAAYCSAAMHQKYFPWCGLAVGYCLANSGVRPVFGSSDHDRFLWASAWLEEGDVVNIPQQGDIVVLDLGAGDEHVTFFERDLGNGYWECLGGNQHHQVRASNFQRSAVKGIRRPSQAPRFVSDTSAAQRFSKCVSLVLASEGGNVDDPRDRGGRTSRGITQDDWDKWRHARPDLPADVYQAPQDQIIAIYHDQYWEAVNGDQLPSGIDYAVFDCGVLNGVGTAARLLQAQLGTAVDGEIGPKTVAACACVDRAALINEICDDRLRRMRGMSNWPIYGAGWTKRVDRVRADALGMVGAANRVPAPSRAVEAVVGDNPKFQQLIVKLEDFLMSNKNTKAPVPLPADADSPTSVADWAQQALVELRRIQGENGGEAPASGQAPESLGLTKSGVKALQEELNDAGYDLGAVDGIYGPLTRAALLAFQADNNLETSGVADEATLAALDRAGSRPLSKDRVATTASDLLRLGSTTVLNGKRVNLMGLLASILGGLGAANSAAVTIANPAKTAGAATANLVPAAGAKSFALADSLTPLIGHIQTLANNPQAKTLKESLGGVADSLKAVRMVDLSPLLTPDNVPTLERVKALVESAQPANADTTQLLNQMIEVANNLGPSIHQAAASTPDLSPILGTAIAPAVATIANAVLPGGGGALVMLGLGLATQLFGNRVIASRVADHRSAANQNR